MSVPPQVVIAGVIMSISFVAVCIGCFCPRKELRVQFEMDDDVELIGA